MDKVKSKVSEEIKKLLDDKTIELADDTPLLGKGSILDSMKLVELCLALEDTADKLGFVFDWTSGSAMSRTRSMFRTVGSLAEEFLSQMEANK